MEDLNHLKNELQNIIIRDDEAGKTNLIKAAQSLLKTSTGASTKIEAKFPSRKEEERALTDFANSHDLFLSTHSLGNYITEGAEQKIHFIEGSDFVIKTADAIFYKTWLDYFNNLLIHNVLFPNTRYDLLGFLVINNQLNCVLKQPYIFSSQITDIEKVKNFMEANGFKLKKNSDYFHPFIGIIIEDLHDENVLTNNDVLFFTDTVIYITENFYQ